jgi:CRP-like cAMP-binding protein
MGTPAPTSDAGVTRLLSHCIATLRVAASTQSSVPAPAVQRATYHWRGVSAEWRGNVRRPRGAYRCLGCLQSHTAAARAAGEAALVTSHMRVLVAVAERPRQSLSEIAAHVGLEVRHIGRLLNELEASGYLSRRRDRSCNRYTVHHDARVRQPGVAGTVGALLAAVRAER